MLVVSAAAGCQEPNPRSCIDGTCTDPSLPFCDADGALAGQPETCIAVACTPGEFAACRGDHAVTCNSEGTSYDLIQCERGCDEAAGGCRLCEPNQTVCANGKVQACDESGAVTESEACPLGCFSEEPRCTKLVPSNGLSQYLPLAADAPVLDFESISIDTTTGEVQDLVSHTPILVPNFSFSTPNAPGVRVFLASSANLRTVFVSALHDGKAGAGNAFALVTKGPLRITGPIKVSFGVGTPKTGCNAGMGHYRIDDGDGDGPFLATGSGGGGNATVGGAGGGVSGFFAGAVGGAPIGNELIVPLQGGCSSGPLDGRDVYGDGEMIDGVLGGGAVQLVSSTEIVFDGKLDVRGGRGAAEADPLSVLVWGGGAGGSVLLEAPIVTMTDRALIIAKGGGGGAVGPESSSDDTANADPGQTCQVQPCSPGGLGGTVGSPPVSALDVTRSGNTGNGYAGGGGGAIGRLRVNTASGGYAKTSMTLEVAATSSGTIEVE